MDTKQNNYYFSTYSGIKFYFDNPTVDMININDIARGLAMQCRFNGQVSDFYSVAEHSVLVSELVPTQLRLAGLLHDATEAYMSDLVSGLKHALPDYMALEDKLTKIIEEKFNIVLTDEDRKKVKQADKIMLVSELRKFHHVDIERISTKEKPIERSRIKALAPKEAMELFLSRYDEIRDSETKRLGFGRDL